ncbi:low choriolytic enzyme-like [Synchiropus splendidus]|uniref:low choriolytic enzyme-like n=1 Tax=Synchiropus splendidus TaxID=270530 RepID=UPI00237E440F|nr:low choriolytic enzyme-like [Synchiropus splendidus]
MMLQAATLGLLLSSIHAASVHVPLDKGGDFSGHSVEEDDSISALLEKANVNVGQDADEPMVMYGDIAMPSLLRNADQCTANPRGCLWPKATDGNVYIPYIIANQYSQRERSLILRGLESFAQSSCIRFTPRNGQRDFISIESRSGCYSFVGRQGRRQVVSLSRQGCIFNQIVQHELLHALGFNHEQTRSDRDQHVRILLQNVIPGMEFNFNKKNTRNLGTPYDYTSVMHYGRFAFSRNSQPTIIPIPNSNVPIGLSRQMSAIDIQRINILYQCNSRQSKPAPEKQLL